MQKKNIIKIFLCSIHEKVVFKFANNNILIRYVNKSKRFRAKQAKKNNIYILIQKGEEREGFRIVPNVNCINFHIENPEEKKIWGKARPNKKDVICTNAFVVLICKNK